MSEIFWVVPRFVNQGHSARCVSTLVSTLVCCAERLDSQLASKISADSGLNCESRHGSLSFNPMLRREFPNQSSQSYCRVIGVDFCPSELFFVFVAASKEGARRLVAALNRCAQCWRSSQKPTTPEDFFCWRRIVGQFLVVCPITERFDAAARDLPQGCHLADYVEPFC